MPPSLEYDQICSYVVYRHVNIYIYIERERERERERETERQRKRVRERGRERDKGRYTCICVYHAYGQPSSLVCPPIPSSLLSAQ